MARVELRVTVPPCAVSWSGFSFQRRSNISKSWLCAPWDTPVLRWGGIPRGPPRGTPRGTPRGFPGDPWGTPRGTTRPPGGTRGTPRGHPRGHPKARYGRLFGGLFWGQSSGSYEDDGEPRNHRGGRPTVVCPPELCDLSGSFWWW
jgi:hypothetical protein